MKDINGGSQIYFVARMALRAFSFPNFEALHPLKLSIAIPAVRTKLLAREITVYSKEDSPIPLRFVGQFQHQAVKRRIVYCLGQMMIFFFFTILCTLISSANIAWFIVDKSL